MLMTLAAQCIMNLLVHACGGQRSFCGTIVVGEKHAAPELLNKRELAGKCVRRDKTGT